MKTLQNTKQRNWNLRHLTQMLLLSLKTLEGCAATFKEKLKTAFAGLSELLCEEHSCLKTALRTVFH